MSRERDAVRDILDMMLSPPTTVSSSTQIRDYLSASNSALRSLRVVRFADGGTVTERALLQRTLVIQRLRDITEMSYRAKSSGLFAPEDPVRKLEKLNQNRTVLSQIPEDPDHVEILAALDALGDLVEKESRGAVVVKRAPAPQAESLSIFFNGIGGLPSAVIDADTLKRQQAFDRLADISFTKRRVRMLFVCERPLPDGRIGLVLGWRRMRDATGYRIVERDVFRGESEVNDVGSPSFDSIDPTVVDFYRRNIAPMFPSLNDDEVVLYGIDGVREHCLAGLRVTAYQRVKSGKNDLFRARVNRLNMQSAELEAVRESMLRFAGPEHLFDTTPYPFIAEALYGDSSFGWALAGLNVVASFERGEEVDRVRTYSYIGANYSTIRNWIETGKFFMPVDKSDMVTRFDASIRDFGLARTLAEVLEKCGVLFFFDERENLDVDSALFDREAALTETSLLSTIISAIDPSSSTVQPADVYAKITRVVKQSAGGKLINREDDEQPRLDTDQSAIDLLTFQGISRFMNVVVDASRRSS